MRTKIRRRRTRTGVRWYVSTVNAAGVEEGHGGYRTRAEAKQAAAQLVADAAAGRYVPRSRRTVGSWLSEWLAKREASGKVAPSTLESYSWAVQAWIAPRIGAVPLQELTAADLERLYAELRAGGGRAGRGLSPKSVRNVHALLSKALADAVRAGHVAANVATLAERPEATRREREAWTVAEARRFLAVADQDRLAAVWRLMLAAGLRRGEVLGLTWDDLDLDSRSVAVRRQVLLRGRSTRTAPRLYVRQTTKGRRPRTIRFDEATRAALKAWRAAQAGDRLAFGPRWRADGGLGIDAPWVVTEADGKVVHPDTLHDRFLRLVERAGVRRLVLHGTRHSFATIALAAGVRPDVVSRALGHASTGFTLDVYVHPSGEEELAAADVVGAALEDRHPPVEGVP
ncbi:MAG TPA: tyrosine-type recombinase/integrase [Actinomycetota bacterium]|nr:tyrosine-type recombinase/integrase [Actinomycetota bacterium]